MSEIIDLDSGGETRTTATAECTIYDNGDKSWHLNGKYHRADGPAIEWADGTKYWFLNGEQHRIDGPAIEFADGTKYWLLNDKYHRTDGPALEYANGDKYWYLNGKRYAEEEFDMVKEVLWAI